MSYVDIPLPRLVGAVALVAIAIVLSRARGLGLEGKLAWASVRGAVQLLAVGYALRLLLAHEHPLATLLVLTTMLVVAAWTASRRVEHGPAERALFGPALVAIATGGAVALLPVFACVIRPSAHDAARLVVPISGMILSNAMNTVALVFERVFASARAEAATIEQLLALGASPEQALHAQSRAAVRAAMTPTINGLLTVGLVALPGMMTGQIVSGTSPESAVRYQIVILYQLVVVAAVSGVVAAKLAQRMLFTPREQLALPAERSTTKGPA
ncbi:MAG: ABC transporter permease [Polyangiales bacterium]